MVYARFWDQKFTESPPEDTGTGIQVEDDGTKPPAGANAIQQQPGGNNNPTFEVVIPARHVSILASKYQAKTKNETIFPATRASLTARYTGDELEAAIVVALAIEAIKTRFKPQYKISWAKNAVIHAPAETHLVLGQHPACLYTIWISKTDWTRMSKLYVGSTSPVRYYWDPRPLPETVEEGERLNQILIDGGNEEMEQAQDPKAKPTKYDKDLKPQVVTSYVTNNRIGVAKNWTRKIGQAAVMNGVGAPKVSGGAIYKSSALV